MSTDHQQIEEHVAEILAVIQPVIEECRAKYADLVDTERRTTPESATDLDRERLKDSNLLAFLGLEPLDGDPTIEQFERELEKGRS